jgi:hypothetical protein
MTRYNEKVLIKDGDMITSLSKFPITAIYQQQLLQYLVVLGLDPIKGEYPISTLTRTNYSI